MVELLVLVVWFSAFGAVLQRIRVLVPLMLRSRLAPSLCAVCTLEVWFLSKLAQGSLLGSGAWFCGFQARWD